MSPQGAPAPAPGSGLAGQGRIEQAWQALAEVLDPEVPALSVCDLGIVRDIKLAGDGLQVVLTPTYSGCPATELIERQVLQALDDAGLGPAQVLLQRAPAWTTDWISPAGRRKLQDYGIAPPGPVVSALAQPMQFVAYRLKPAALACTRCGSDRTERLSAFGSTACKSLHRCLDCLEPFEHFKPL